MYISSEICLSFANWAKRNKIKNERLNIAVPGIDRDRNSKTRSSLLLSSASVRYSRTKWRLYLAKLACKKEARTCHCPILCNRSQHAPESSSLSIDCAIGSKNMWRRRNTNRRADLADIFQWEHKLIQDSRQFAKALRDLFRRIEQYKMNPILSLSNLMVSQYCGENLF